MADRPSAGTPAAARQQARDAHEILMRTPVPRFLLLAGALAACSADRSPVAPHPRSDQHLSRDLGDSGASSVWRDEFAAVADGLLYGSEGDYPFQPFFIDAAETDSLTVAAFRRLARIDPETPVDTRTLDGFFARHIELVPDADPAARALIPRYRYLRETLRGALLGVSVYCVGRVALECHIVGLDEYGRVDGMVTIAIET
jgi:hypothetical protein